MAEVTSPYDSETAGPENDPVTLTRGRDTSDISELRLRLTPDLHGQLSAMFAGYGIGSLEEGLLKSLGLWRYVDRSLREGRQLVVIDPQHPQGPFDVIDLQSW
ncbi:hypothetical protein [Kineosporia babensis]|uniref:Uncharacterized protein n=1 Tax=Kineosporia babensis TaxID=499548 RepID=A0A9X1SVJ1_9ACTN|nr:hypothetical protein [Kineosporia babensis]MCD5312910.1 hypothetical protein [Kineosporia babensis]